MDRARHHAINRSARAHGTPHAIVSGSTKRSPAVADFGSETASIVRLEEIVIVPSNGTKEQHGRVSTTYQTRDWMTGTMSVLTARDAYLNLIERRRHLLTATVKIRVVQPSLRDLSVRPSQLFSTSDEDAIVAIVKEALVNRRKTLIVDLTSIDKKTATDSVPYFYTNLIGRLFALLAEPATELSDFGAVLEFVVPEWITSAWFRLMYRMDIDTSALTTEEISETARFARKISYKGLAYFVRQNRDLDETGTGDVGSRATADSTDAPKKSKMELAKQGVQKAKDAAQAAKAAAQKGAAFAKSAAEKFDSFKNSPEFQAIQKTFGDKLTKSPAFKQVEQIAEMVLEVSRGGDITAIPGMEFATDALKKFGPMLLEGTELGAPEIAIPVTLLLKGFLGSKEGRAIAASIVKGGGIGAKDIEAAVRVIVQNVVDARKSAKAVQPSGSA